MSAFDQVTATQALLKDVFRDDRKFKLAVAHEEMNSRRRNTMEDVHRILPTLSAGLEQYSYFGIYDGHGGRQIVDFLEDALEQNIAIELKEPDDAIVLERMSRYCSSYVLFLRQKLNAVTMSTFQFT